MEDILSDSEVEDINARAESRVAKVSPASLMNNPLPYDNAISHHFIQYKCDFISIQKFEKPLNFYQVIGKSSLNYQGSSRLKKDW